MEFVRSLRQLWRHRYFRRLLAVRVATQSSDGVLQIALASYVLFSPERQPDAASIAAVLAITLLPFSILGPFVGVVLDRVARRQVLVVVDLLRAVLAVEPGRPGRDRPADRGTETVFYGGVLLAMSLNRFLLAALSASLPHTIDVQRVHGGQLGGAHGRPGRGADRGRPRHGAAAGAGPGDAGLLGQRGPVRGGRRRLRAEREPGAADPPPPARAGRAGADPTPSDVVAGLAEALAHLRERRAGRRSACSPSAAHRIIYGIVTVATILVYRNYFHTLDQVEPAIADLGLLVVVTGAGFVFAAVVTPPVTARLGIRRWMIVCLVGLGGLPDLPRGDLRQGAAGDRRVPARADRAEHQDLRGHPGAGARGRRVQGPGVRALRHGLQRGAGAGRGDRGRDPAGRRGVGADPGRAGRRLPAGGGLFAYASRGLAMNAGTESLTAAADRA